MKVAQTTWRWGCQWQKTVYGDNSDVDKIINAGL